MTSKKVPECCLIKKAWKVRLAGCFLFTPLHNLVKRRHSRDRWSTWHFDFYSTFFWGGGVEASNKCVCGVCDRDGVWVCGHCEGNSIIRKCVCLSVFFLFLSFFFNSELQQPWQVWVHFPNQTHARHSVVILAATEFVWGESRFRGII